jgi:AraC-like DNA-binding protein
MLTFPMELLDATINAANPELVGAAQRFVANEMRRHPLDMAKQIEGLVARQLAIGPCSLPSIALQMNMSVRTLQRRLKEKGHDFADIVDKVRRQRALELLQWGAIPVGQVHALVGYEDQSSLILLPAGSDKRPPNCATPGA